MPPRIGGDEVCAARRTRFERGMTLGSNAENRGEKHFEFAGVHFEPARPAATN